MKRLIRSTSRPRTEATRRLIALAGVPIAAPSANRSGKPSTTTAAHVLHDMDGRIEAILDGGACEVGVESTIIDLTGERPRLLRPGFHGLTGGVYKARERIHRAMADARLLANPASWGRVADPSPN